MSNWLLFSDTHFTDSEKESYRWDIFKKLKTEAIKHDISRIYHLGDTTDRRDRHSAILVNRLIDEFSDLHRETAAEILILAGNHDAPITGPYFWTFLNSLKGVRYILEPELYESVWLLPFSSNPVESWKDLDLGSASALFMHQTIQGALIENDRTIPTTPHPMPKLPDIPIYSGDVHHFQTINGIVYVGAPHPVRFSESWKNRVILIENDDFKHPKDIWLDSIKRAILDLKDISQLDRLSYGKRDQIRVRMSLKAERLCDWSNDEKRIRAWAEERGVHIASIEATLEGDGVGASTSEKIKSLEVLKPSEVIQEFGKKEELNNEVIQMGLELVKNSI